jgi:large subunit ribosomal protein L27e
LENLKGVVSSDTFSEPTQREDTKKTFEKRDSQPFIEVVNYSHLFPSRYALVLENLKGAVSSDTFSKPTQRKDAKKTIGR